MQLDIQEFLPTLANAWSISVAELRTYYADLQSRRECLSALNTTIRDVPEFSGVQFQHVKDLRMYRSLLYLLTRIVQPDIFVETGVLNGFGSAFILLP